MFTKFHLECIPSEVSHRKQWDTSGLVDPKQKLSEKKWDTSGLVDPNQKNKNVHQKITSPPARPPARPPVRPLERVVRGAVAP